VLHLGPIHALVDIGRHRSNLRYRNQTWSRLVHVKLLQDASSWSSCVDVELLTFLSAIGFLLCAFILQLLSQFFSLKNAISELLCAKMETFKCSDQRFSRVVWKLLNFFYYFKLVIFACLKCITHALGYLWCCEVSSVTRIF
jgi:hypothetical protein